MNRSIKWLRILNKEEEKEKTLTIRDRGIGMTAEEIDKKVNR